MLKLKKTLIPALLIIIVISGTTEAGNSFVASVNGEHISVKEFQRNINKNRAGVFNYFYKKYGVKQGGDFWDKKHGDETPLDMIRRLALEQCVRVKVQQVIAMQKGTVSDISYSSFLVKLKKDNIARKKAVENNEIIYGPVQYGEDQYFNHLLRLMVIKLKEKLAEDELAVTEDEIKRYYEDKKEILYKNDDLIEIQVYSIDHKGEKKMPGNKSLSILEDVKARIMKGGGSDEFKNVCRDELTFSEETARADEIANYELKEKALELEQGGISKIFDSGQGYYFIKCVKRIKNRYKPYSLVRDVVRQNLVDEKYKKFLEELIKKATVNINSEVYGNITVR